MAAKADDAESALEPRLCIDAGAPYTLRVEATSSTNSDVWHAFDEHGISSNMLRNCSRIDPHLHVELFSHDPSTCTKRSGLKSDDITHTAASAAAPRLDAILPARFMVQHSAPVLVSGAGFIRSHAVSAGDGDRSHCRLTPSVLPGGGGGTTWSYGGSDPTAWSLFSNLSRINTTHAVCTPPTVLIEGPGTLAVSVDGGRTYSNELRIDYVNLFSVAFGRRPYISEPTGELVFRSDRSLQGQKLAVHATLPSVSGKSWNWTLDGGVDLLLPLDFDVREDYRPL